MNHEEARKYALNKSEQIAAECGDDVIKRAKAVDQALKDDPKYARACWLVQYRTMVEEQNTRH